MAVFNTRLAALLISLSVVLSAASANTDVHSPPALDELSSYFSGLKEHFRFLQESSFAPPEEHATNPPEEHATKDMGHYLTEQMSSAVKMVQNFTATTLAKRLNDASTDEYTKKVLLACEGMYKDAVLALNNGMKSVSAGDFVQARTETHTFMYNINACGDSSMEFQTFGEWAREVGGDCLAKIVEHMDPEE